MSASPPASGGGHHRFTRTSGNPPGITLPSEAGDKESSISSADEQQAAAGVNEAVSAPASSPTTPVRPQRSSDIDEPQRQQGAGAGSTPSATLSPAQLPPV